MVTAEPSVIEGISAQFTIKLLCPTPGALKFVPLTIAMSVVPAFEIPALGMSKEVKDGLGLKVTFTVVSPVIFTFTLVSPGLPPETICPPVTSHVLTS